MKNNILDHISAELKKATAGEWVGPCPQCGGKDRFHVWPDRDNGGGFWCRACGWKGDGIQFIRDTHGVGYVEACRILSVPPKDTGPRAKHRSPAWEPKASFLPGKGWASRAREFVAYTARQMEVNPKAQEYAKGRGLNAETVQALSIGWNPSTSFQDRAIWGLDEEIDDKTGKPSKVCLPFGLVIPTINTDGTVVAIKIRRANYEPGDKFGKYSAIAKGSNDPFILLPGQGKPVVVVESELDAILIAQEAGSLVTAVAMRSAKNQPDAQTHAMLSAAPAVLVALDFDDTGKKGAGWWLKTYTTAMVWVVPVGKDVGDLIVHPGSVRFWIKEGLRISTEVATCSRIVTAKEQPPYSIEALEQYNKTHSHLVCCPDTQTKWNWRYLSACTTCENSNCYRQE